VSKLQPVRGTHDILPEEYEEWRHVTEQCRVVASRYGFQEISTPIFEFTEVFQRTLGDTSDIVSKEMYTFEDRSGTSITLRPENTAGVARALISNGLSQSLPLKFFYFGPMFRYERPQKGRLRQFHQFGVELLGVPEPLGDVEIISLGAQSLNQLDILNLTRLEINSLGDRESRASYREVLVKYLKEHSGKLSKESLQRLDHNPMRVLDSKEAEDREIVLNAPYISEYLNRESQDFFLKVCDGLDKLGIAYTINSKLVRGLDYYCHTAFEFVTDNLGAQGTVLAGGRYDGLLEMMGGKPTAGIGWAAGIERLSSLINFSPKKIRPVSVVPIGDLAEDAVLPIVSKLRQNGFPVDLGYRGNLSKRMKRANALNSSFAVILGEDEISKGTAIIRNLDTGDQQEVEIISLCKLLSELLPKIGNVN